jgi:SAM-dependent methyltransferase
MNMLRDVEYWVFSDISNEEARKANDARVVHETTLANEGKLIKDVHSEALRDYADIKKLILAGLSFFKKLGYSMHGDAADLGSGTGIGAAILSNIQDIDNIYAIEYSEQFLLKMMPVVFSEFNAQKEKIIRVVGDFNKLKLENGSLSLILDIDSFHHSENLEITFKECFRVLKPGGVIVSIDRAWPDSFTREQLDKKLEIEYSDASKAMFGIPPGQSYKRRDNGEHEYTIKDWLSTYKDTGFDAYVFSQIHPPRLNTIFLKVISGFKISQFISLLLGKLGVRRLFLYGFNPTRKLFVAIKR